MFCGVCACGLQTELGEGRVKGWRWREMERKSEEGGEEKSEAERKNEGKKSQQKRGE